jgi:eukaryotic-like serine/threonine-protein kinase
MPEKQPHSTPLSPTAQAEDAFWEKVTQRLDDYLNAWTAWHEEKAEEPCIAHCLSGFTDADRDVLLRELIKIDLEQRWHHDCEPRQVEDYLEEFPELGPLDSVSVELIYEELQARMQAGQQITEQLLHARFPRQADHLCWLLGGMSVPGNVTDTHFVATNSDGSDVCLASPAAAGLSPGEQVDDFQLLTPLGEGTFATVFLARQLSLDRLVALKVSTQASNESRTLAQLDHANIVRVHDQRQVANPPRNLLYMEIVPGGTLRDVVAHVRETDPSERTGQLLLDSIDRHLGACGAAVPESSPPRSWLAKTPWPLAVCQLGAQLADGLAYAHARGVFHRDIKPANVLLTPEASPKLADFNISFNGGRAGEDPADTFGGSLAYMSPEQLEASHRLLRGSPKRVREASDIYAMGILLWELVCGRRPFSDGDRKSGTLALLQRMIDQRRNVDWSVLAQQLPKDCPASLRKILWKCLQPCSDDRYRSAEELARALRLCLNVRCWQLLHPPSRLSTRWILRWPLFWLVAVGLIPNALAGWFNLLYNRIAIVGHLPELTARFEKVYWTINCIAFPLGVTVVLWVALRIQRQLHQDDSDSAIAAAARRLLLFGRFVTAVSMLLWLFSGLLFPIALDWGDLIGAAPTFYSHFFLSLALCGLIASVYPYFFLTLLAVHWYLPAMIRARVLAGPARSDLQTLRSLNRLYLVLTALVPMLSIWLVVMFRSEESWVPVVVSAAGLLGLAVMFTLERIIDRDLTALDHLAK